MKKKTETEFRLPHICVIVSLALMTWIANVGLAGGPYPMTTSANPESGGTVVADPSEAPEGGSVTFTVTANTGYCIERVILNREEIDPVLDPYLPEQVFQNRGHQL